MFFMVENDVIPLEKYKMASVRFEVMSCRRDKGKRRKRLPMDYCLPIVIIIILCMHGDELLACCDGLSYSVFILGLGFICNKIW